MREGYKMTTIGEVPEDWDLVPIYELRNKADRYSFTGGPFGSDLKSEHYTSKGIRIIQLQDIGEGNFLNKSQIYTSEEKADQLISCNIYPGEIILAKMAPVARCCKIPNTDKRFVMCSDGIRLSVDTTLYDNEFVYQALNSKYFRNEAESQSTGTTRARIGLNDLKLIPIAVPQSLAEQQRIAEILSTVDEKIEVIEEQISQTTELKKGLMQRLLTKGVGHTQFKTSPLGEIPVSWEVVKLGDVLIQSPEYGANASAIEFANDTYRYVRITDINDVGKLIPTGIVGITKAEGGPYLLKEDDIIIARTGNTVGKSYIHKSENGECAYAGYLIRFVLNKSVYVPQLLFHFLHSNTFWTWVKSTLRTGAQPNINSKEYQSLKIPLPPISEQLEITGILDTLDEKLQVLQEKKEKYLELKKGLMQQLLTGKLRVHHLIENPVPA